jgi:heme exporter protein A
MDSAAPSPDTQGGLIEARDLVKRFALRPVLRALTLSVPRGQTLALMGPNGSGKSTLVRLICGLSRPDSGTLTVGGWALPNEAQQVRPHLGLVAHRPLIYEGLTARENLRFYGRLYNLPADTLDARIKTLLARVGLARRADDVTRGFSRGMFQRLAIARALLHEPDILLLDEPFTGLDPGATALLSDIISAARSEGHTIVMTTHDPAHAVSLAERVAILHRGALVHDSPTASLTTDTLAALYAELTT